MSPSPQHRPIGATRDDARDYIYDMIAELAVMARRSGEYAVAIHLEAILATRARCGAAD